MSNKIIIEEFKQFQPTIDKRVVGIITQEPQDIYENHRLSLCEISNVTAAIAKEVESIKCRYRLEMRLMTKEDVDFYLEECNRILKGGKATPVYANIDEFLSKYKSVSSDIINDLKIPDSNNYKHKFILNRNLYINRLFHIYIFFKNNFFHTI